jgi:hypothetical protein
VDITTVQPQKENVTPVVATDGGAADPFAEFDRVVRTGDVGEVPRLATHMLLQFYIFRLNRFRPVPEYNYFF